jgi:hypothetical protein
MTQEHPPIKRLDTNALPIMHDVAHSFFSHVISVW